MTSILSNTIAVPLAPQKDCKAMRFNPSGKYIAVCTNEGTCVLYGASVLGGDGRSAMLSTIRGHAGPVWDCAFSPTGFGSICATGGSDRKILVHKENAQTGQWDLLHSDESHGSHVTSVDFSATTGTPLSVYQVTALASDALVGLHLASGSLDGSVTIHSLCADHSWQKKSFVAHIGGVNCVRWATIDTPRTSLGDGTVLGPTRRLATCGVDGLVAIWMCHNDLQWMVEEKLCGHYRNVIDLSWMPAGDSGDEKIVSLGDDGTIIFWYKASGARTWALWQRLDRACVGSTKVGWSLDGSIVAASTTAGFPPVKLFQVDLRGQWEVIENASNSGGGQRSYNATSGATGVPVF